MTQHNPFTPPKAEPLRFMEKTTRPPRPISAWLLEALLAFIAAAGLVGLWRLVWMVALDPQNLRSPIGLALAVAWQIGLFVVLALAIRGIHRGRHWARWLGLVLIVAFAVFSVARPDHSTYPNDAQRAGAELGRYAIVPLLCVWWAWAFAFSAKAKRFFAPSGLVVDGEPVAS